MPNLTQKPNLHDIHVLTFRIKFILFLQLVENIHIGNIFNYSCISKTSYLESSICNDIAKKDYVYLSF